MNRRHRQNLVRLVLTALASALAAGVAASGQARAAYPGSNGRIAFTRGDSIYVYSISSRLGCERFLTDGSGPVWSPDGTKLAFIRNGNVYTTNEDGTGQHRLTADGSAAPDVGTKLWISGRPTWSPDGKKIAYAYDNLGSFFSPANWDIHVIDATTGALLGHPADTGQDEYAPSWSPDGSTIAYADKDHGIFDGDKRYRIMTMNVDGTGKTQLGPWFDWANSPDWSPDGKTLAFAGSSHMLYTADAATGIATRSSWPGADPAWSPDGTKLLDWNETAYGTATEVMIVDAGSLGVGKTRTRLLTDAEQPNWQPVGPRTLDCLVPAPLPPDPPPSAG